MNGVVAWFTSGGFLLVVAGALLLEGVALLLLFRRTGQGVPPASLVPGLASGGLMLAACGAAWQGAGWLATAALLLAAGALHAADLRSRWLRGR